MPFRFAVVSVLVALVSLFGPRPARSQDLVIARGYLEDPTGHLTLADVREKLFTPYSGVLSLGYLTHPTWVRLTVRGLSETEADSSWVGDTLALRLEPTYIDEILVYDTVNPDEPTRAGDRHPPVAHDHDSLAQRVVIAASVHPRDVYLRLRTTSATVLRAEVLTLDDAEGADEAEALRSGLVVGALTLLLLATLAAWVMTRHRLVLLCAAMLAAAMVSSLVSLGFARLLLGATEFWRWADHGYNVAAILGLGVAVTVHRAILLTFGLRPRISQWLHGVSVATALEILAVALGFPQQAMQANGLLAVVAAALLCLGASTCEEAVVVSSAYRSALRWLAGMYAAMLAGFIAWALGANGLINAPVAVLFAPQVFGLIATVTLMALVTTTVQRRAVVTSHLAARAVVAEERAEFEFRERVEKDAFLAMLTHELKTPLSVIGIALGDEGASTSLRKRARNAVANIGSVVDRSAMAARVDEPHVRQRSACDVQAELLLVLADFENRERFVVSVEPGLPIVSTDGELLRVVIRNLLENAYKYGAPSSPIEVSLRHEALRNLAGVACEVTNAPGPAGVPEPRLVFQRYYRAAGAKRHTGSGLGLYLSRAFARRLDGTLDYLPDPSATKVRFRLWIPV